MLNAENVRKIFDYEPLTGNLIWRSKIAKKVSVGFIAGPVTGGNGNRRCYVGVYGGRYLSSRVVWLWHNLKWPDGEIDHIDRNPLNNKIENLRDVSRSSNILNTRNRCSLIGLAGVQLADKSDKFVAKITVGKTQKYLGSYETPEDARAAYVAAHIEAHGIESKYHQEHVHNLALKLRV